LPGSYFTRYNSADLVEEETMFNELGLGRTRKGHIYNTNRLSTDEQREAACLLLQEIRLANCSVTFIVTSTGPVLELYKRTWAGGWRLIDRYRESDPLSTVFRAWLDRNLEPASVVEQESFRAALARRVA
jgi:hypothetical protein